MGSDQQSDSESTDQLSDGSSSPPPPAESSPPPPEENQSSPPPPEGNQSPPPPPEDNQSSPPPPEDDNQSSPPPPSDNQSSPPPPPSGDQSSQPPPSPSDDQSSASFPSSHSPLPHASSSGSPGSSKQGSSPSSDKKQLRGESGSSSSEKKNSGNKKSSKSNHGDKDELSSDAVAGLAAGAALLLVVMVLLIFCCIKKKKKRNAQYISTRLDDDYYNKASSPHMPSDYFMNVPPPLGASPKPWMPAAPLPPPPNVISTDMSSGAFSSPYGPPVPPPHPSVALGGFNKSTFTFEELLSATGCFSEANLLGQGGFGYVHKGVLPNGKEIAVKSLKASSGQGDREFQAEVDIISRVHHRYLVSLVGYCISGQQKLLVYEFVPNQTLEHHLYGENTPGLDWPTRLKIALGSAKGLAYLHEDCHPRIIHRDIKAANILLENNFDAKVADFGLAKLNQDNYTHVSTRVMGTFGYLAPEYASSGKLTEKSDVFSFGIMLLELITGRPPVDKTGRYEDSLVDWARPLCARALDSHVFDELVDPRLEEYNKQEMSCMVACAIASVRHSARRRPKMSEIVRTLEGDVSLDCLNDVTRSSTKSSGTGTGIFSSDSSEYDSSYDVDINNFKKLAMGKHNFDN